MLSETLPIVLAKLVKKILKGELIDVVELLKDNMEMERWCSVEVLLLKGT